MIWYTYIQIVKIIDETMEGKIFAYGPRMVERLARVDPQRTITNGKRDIPIFIIAFVS